MMDRLSPASVADLPPDVLRPGYDRIRHGFGIVHFGVGAFHRAHQAWYTDAALAQGGGDWRICGVSLRSSTAREQLAPQECLFTVVEKSETASTYRLVASLGDVIYAPADHHRLRDVLLRPETRIVTLTITEKGYLHDPATGRLNRHDPDILHDLSHPEAPKTAVGQLVSSLAERRKKGIAPFTLLSCDNLPENGTLLRTVLADCAALMDDGLAAWIEAEVACPCTMVDRIVPATTESDRLAAAQHLGVHDAAVVVTEPFSQWVIEDSFPLGRPRWEAGGALFTADVKCFEIMKLRLLNGAHSLLAYLGTLADLATVSDCMHRHDLKTLCERLMREELLPTVHLPAGFDARGYIGELLERFANPGLNHELKKIAMDGSQKVVPRWLAAARERLARGEGIELLGLAVAAWMRYACGVDEQGRAIALSDPLAHEFGSRVAGFREHPEETVTNLLAIRQIFGDDLPADHHFCACVKRSFTMLCRLGARETIHHYLQQ